MPASLDAEAQKIILAVVGFTSALILGTLLRAHLNTLPKCQEDFKSENRTFHVQPPALRSLRQLLLGCLATLSLMAAATVLVVMPVLARGPARREPVSESESEQQHTIHGNSPASAFAIPASINFCEEDFVYSSFIAEPVNVASSLTSYVPLALLGLVGPAASQSRGHLRFVAPYCAILAIGLGSVALHALLVAAAQGGDELPMLWYVASTSHCSFDICRSAMTASTAGRKSCGRGEWLGGAVAASAVVATAVYLGMRDNFVVFFILFSAYVVMTIFGIIWISFGLDWECRHGEMGRVFQATVLSPLSISLGWFTLAAQWIWAAEMVWCESVIQHRTLGEGVAPFLWNRAVHPLWHYRAVHPLWHCTTAIVAWLVVQVLLGTHGVQHCWGIPVIRWFGAPYVTFVPSTEHSKQGT